MSNLKNFLFTSESVSEGHPDKVSDRISDMVVDSFISGDPYSRVACETLTTTNKVVLAGEVRGPEINKDELIENIKKIYNKIINPKILFPNFANRVVSIFLDSIKSMKPDLFISTFCSITPSGLIIAVVPLFADLKTYFPLSIALKIL